MHGLNCFQYLENINSYRAKVATPAATYAGRLLKAINKVVELVHNSLPEFEILAGYGKIR